jgi:P22 coat protein - gene protein 5
VAIGDTVKVPVAPTRSTSDYTPAMTTTAGTDATASTVDVQITANKFVSWNMTGEQLRSLENGGTDMEWVRQMIAQGMRALRNGAEIAACTAIKQGASRAVGTAGTNPFASNIDIIPDARKVLFDNGAPMVDLQMCIDSTAGTAARKLGIIQQAYQAGNDSERRSGDLLRQFGFQIRESAGIGLHTIGTGASYLLNGALAVGDTTVTVDTGSGTILAGDIVTFAGTSTKYVVNTALSGATFAIGRPGSRAIEADNDAVTVGGAYTANLAFERNAVVGIMRPPVMPPNPLMQNTLISDPMGMTYLLCQIAGDGMATWRLHLAYGFKVVQTEHVAIVLG